MIQLLQDIADLRWTRRKFSRVRSITRYGNTARVIGIAV